MSDEPKRQSWKWIGWAGLALIALNPLSFGPAVALNRATEDGFYKPMWMLADSKLFGDIIGHYLYFWQGIFGPCGRWPHGHWR
jgi:hypothetical protein